VRLAEAGAFDGIGLSRRDALWRVRGLVSEAGDDVVLERLHGTATFRALDAHDAITWDHEVTFHSTRGHPMQRFRELLRSMHVPDSSEVRAMKDGTRADYVGMVICRQRPGTASGVTFFTLEDEVGFVNLVVWVRVFEQYERIARTAGLLGVHGLIQSKDGVVHLIAEKLWVPGLEGGARMGSRDFH
jgi:error-prone DNA polymerase